MKKGIVNWQIILAVAVVVLAAVAAGMYLQRTFSQQYGLGGIDHNTYISTDQVINLSNMPFGGGVALIFPKTTWHCCENVTGEIHGPPNLEVGVWGNFNDLGWKLIETGRLDSSGSFVDGRPLCTSGDYRFIAVAIDRSSNRLYWSPTQTLTVSSCTNPTSSTLNPTTTLQATTTTNPPVNCGMDNYPQCSQGTCAPNYACQMVSKIWGETCECLYQGGNTPPTTVPPIPGCFDSDGGVNPNVPGYVDYQFAESVDTCVGSTMLNERFCNGLGVADSTLMPCGGGHCETNFNLGKPLGVCVPGQII